jgi:acetyltransferase-like isoleucine patch superfamily enzyme
MKGLVQPLVIVFSSLFLSGERRQKLLRRMFGHEVHPTARIGLSFISVEHLYMAENTGIASLTLIRGLRECLLHEEVDIGRFNWITAIPLHGTEFFQKVENRDPSLEVKFGSVILHRHIVDCNAKVTIGELSGLAGYRTTVLTHGVDIRENAQTATPVTIGDRTMVASNCVLLGGAVVPDYSVVSAGSTVRDAFTEPGLYSGVPATRVSGLPQDAKFFHRTTKMIY